VNDETSREWCWEIGQNQGQLEQKEIEIKEKKKQKD
jgi:hypothetical protein